MSKAPRTPREPRAGFTLGRQSFAKISAVEGIHLSADMEKRFQDFDRQGTPASERREVIARTFAKRR